VSRISLRIDKWLWAARFFKTRSLAQAAVENGRVTLDGERVKPAKEVKVADRLAVRVGDSVREVTVDALADKRGSAVVAAGLYTESEESRLKRAAQAENRRLNTEPALGLHGRPTKRDRRSIAKVRGY
jgi:ribosome-associated heat shock protein Hsp15